jgi:uncharacterized DUF497 family protein
LIYFIWDPLQAETNLRKHGVRFEDAASVFDDLSTATFKERIASGEQRWQTFGMFDVQLLVVAHAIHLHGEDKYIRIISTRRANKTGRRRHEIQNEQ